MTLVISTDDTEKVISMDRCIEALELAFGDLEAGRAADRPRARTFTHLGKEPGLFYLYSSMDGSLPRFGVHGVRMTSEHIHDMRVAGNVSREQPAAAPGGRFVGLILIFSLETIEPLAFIQDAVCNRYMVGATSAIAAKYLSRPESTNIGLIGSGWLAGTQLLGLRAVRNIKHVKVFSRRTERANAFCKEWQNRLGITVVPANSAKDAIAGVDIVALATSSHEPVIRGEWLEPGQHVGSLQGGEIDFDVLERASILSCRSVEKEAFYFTRGPLPRDYTKAKILPPWLLHKAEGLGEIILGRAGRRHHEDITFHGGGGTGVSSGLGIQELAVAYTVYEEAKRKGLGREIPTDLFLEVHHP
jgi:ornithine cyclodeaminase/alanine dehydrogenase-like protein (mu-crystallin family)